MKITRGNPIGDWLVGLKGGFCFGRHAQQAGVAAQQQMIQLFNPAASNVIARVKTFFYTLATAGVITAGFDNVARATDVGAGFNLRDGGAAAVCHIRKDSLAVPPGLSDFYVSGNDNVHAMSPQGDWVCELLPNQGFTVLTSSVNTTIDVAFWWMEVAQT